MHTTQVTNALRRYMSLTPASSWRDLALLIAACLLAMLTPHPSQAQVNCLSAPALVGTIPQTANASGTSGVVTIDYNISGKGNTVTVSAGAPSNAVVTAVSVSNGSKTTSGIVLSTACLQHGTSGWPVDFLSDYAGLAAFNQTNVSSAGPWLLRPVVTVANSNSVLELVVTINWQTPQPTPPAPPPALQIQCSQPNPSLKVGVNSVFGCSATGGTMPYHWKVYGTLPSGLTFQQFGESAYISGTTSASGTYKFTVEVDDSSPRMQGLAQDFSGAIPPSGIGTYDLASPKDLSIPFDYDGSGKLDHLLMYRPGDGIVYILKRSGSQYTPVFASFSGIGGYDLRSPKDRIIPFDYDGSGKLDHLVMYRPGDGIVWVLKNNAGTFTPVYAGFNGIGSYDLRSDKDQIVSFDYDGTGKQDHLVMYRPGDGIVYILSNAGGQFSPVFASFSGIGGYDLRSPKDQIVPFDFDGSGKADHLVMYRPGDGIIFILGHAGSQFSPVFASFNGIGGYDLRSDDDRFFSFDYSDIGKQDHIVFYRPGSGTIWILWHGSDNYFAPVYAAGAPGNGIGEYDLADPADHAFAFDYDGSGKLDHLAMYRPGKGSFFWILQNSGGSFSPVYVPR